MLAMRRRIAARSDCMVHTVGYPQYCERVSSMVTSYIKRMKKEERKKKEKEKKQSVIKD